MEGLLEKISEELQIDKSQWTPTKFGDVAIQQKGKVDRDNTDLTRYVQGGHMNSEDLHLRSWGELEDEYLGPAFIRRFDEGDILYGSRRTYLRKVVIAPFSGITSNTTFVIRANEKNIDKRLLPFIMMSEGFTENSVRNSKGSVNPYINWKDIAKYEFLLPPKDQQAQLAKLLWAMDEVIEKEKELFNKLKTNYLVIRKKKLNNKKFFEDRIEDLAKTSAGGTPSTKREDFWNGDVPWINSGKLKNKLISSPSKMITKLGIEKSSAKLWDKNTTLIALTGATTGEIGYLDFECSGNQSIVAIKSNGKILDKYFFYYLIEFKHRILQQAIGSAQPHINKDIVDKFKMRYPEIDEQSVLIKEFDRFVDLMQINLEKINFSQSLQKSLINQIF